MSLFIDAYAKIAYSSSVFLMRRIYKQQKKQQEQKKQSQPNKEVTFSVEGHTKMVKLSNLAYKVFNVVFGVTSKKIKYNYVIPVCYDDCKLLIRPFQFFDILMVSGLWEPYVRSIFDNELKKTDTVVEIGANIGIYAIPLAKRVSKVIAFEPHPETSKMLEESIKLNNLSNTVLVKKPVADSEGKVLFNLSADPPASTVITRPDNTHSSTIEMESVDLDTALAKENKIDWLLIDVVGFEVSVFNGARNTLRNHSPKIIFESPIYNYDKINKILTSEGYSVTHLYGLSYFAVKLNLYGNNRSPK